MLLSAPIARSHICSRICSPVLQSNAQIQIPFLTRDEVASILCARQQEIGDLGLQDVEKVLESCLGPALGDGAKYQRQLHTRIFVQLLLQNARTLTKLHFKSKVDILDGFQSIDAFYKLLIRLPVLNDLQVSGDIISIVALKQVSPNLTSLHLISKYPENRRLPGYFQNLLKPVQLSGPEWSCLSVRADIRPIESLSLNYIVSSTELHWVLAHLHLTRST